MKSAKPFLAIGGLLLAAAVLIIGVGKLTAAELEPGDKAPEFALVGSDGKTYRLSDYRGETVVVLAWFPKAFTPGCTTECKAMARKDNPLKKYNVAYFTASCDSAETNAKFAKSVGADYPILADPSCETAEKYGVVNSVRRWPQRWTFIIGTDGRILHVDKNVRPGSHAADVAEKLEELGVPKRDPS
jgi:peroxiredoxin Q/BCP